MCHTDSYDDTLMFAQISATMMAATRMPALPDSVRRNARNGAVISLVVHGVRSVADSDTPRLSLIMTGTIRSPHAHRLAATGRYRHRGSAGHD